MKSNKSKCSILHLGQSNIGHKSKLGEVWLENNPAGRDLWVLVDSRLNMSAVCPGSQEVRTASWGASNTA